MGWLKDFMDGFSAESGTKPIFAFLFILFLLAVAALGMLLSKVDGW